MGEMILHYKNLEVSRCPWCGEILKDLEPEKHSRALRMICSFCHKESKYYQTSIESLITIFTGILIGVLIVRTKGFGELRYTLLLLAAPYFIYHLMHSKSLPFHRYPRRKYPERFLGRASIFWYPTEKGGIGSAHIRMINNMILPVCFVDEKGNPVSQTVCIRLKKRFWFLWRNVGVSLVTDDLWKPDKNGIYPWEKADKIIIYTGGDIIGEGKVKKRGMNRDF